MRSSPGSAAENKPISKNISKRVSASIIHYKQTVQPIYPVSYHLLHIQMDLIAL